MTDAPERTPGECRECGADLIYSPDSVGLCWYCDPPFPDAPERTPLKVKLSTLVSVTERAKKAEAEVERLRAAIRDALECADEDEVTEHHQDGIICGICVKRLRAALIKPEGGK